MPPVEGQTIETDSNLKTVEVPVPDDQELQHPEYHEMDVEAYQVEKAERERMAEEARAIIARQADDPSVEDVKHYDGPEGFKNLVDTDLQSAHDQLAPAAEQGVPNAVQLQQRYAGELSRRAVMEQALEHRGVDGLSRRQPEAAPTPVSQEPTVADKVERGGWRQFFNRG